jgi:hypothetical protein
VVTRLVGCARPQVLLCNTNPEIVFARTAGERRGWCVSVCVRARLCVSVCVCMCLCGCVCVWMGLRVAVGGVWWAGWYVCHCVCGRGHVAAAAARGRAHLTSAFDQRF